MNADLPLTGVVSVEIFGVLQMTEYVVASQECPVLIAHALSVF